MLSIDLKMDNRMQRCLWWSASRLIHKMILQLAHRLQRPTDALTRVMGLLVVSLRSALHKIFDAYVRKTPRASWTD
jgi:hypothetical protein